MANWSNEKQEWTGLKLFDIQKEIFSKLLEVSRYPVQVEDPVIWCSDIEYEVRSMVNDTFEFAVGEELATTDKDGFTNDADYKVDILISYIFEEVAYKISLTCYYCKSDKGKLIIRDAYWSM